MAVKELMERMEVKEKRRKQHQYNMVALQHLDESAIEEYGFRSWYENKFYTIMRYLKG